MMDIEDELDKSRFEEETTMMRKTHVNNKRAQGFKLALAIVIFLAVECGLFAFWRFGAYYPARAALLNNSHTVTVSSPIIEIERGLGKNESHKIHITSDGMTYTLDWSNTPRSAGLDPEEFAARLEAESWLTLTVKENNRVCAVQGETETYLSVEDFNSYQKKQSVTGTVLLVVIELIVVIGFAGAIFVIRSKMQDG